MGRDHGSHSLPPFPVILVSGFACSSTNPAGDIESDSGSTDTGFAETGSGPAADAGDTPQATIDAGVFVSGGLAEAITIVDCTLSGGRATPPYQNHCVACDLFLYRRRRLRDVSHSDRTHDVASAGKNMFIGCFNGEQGSIQ